MATDNGDDAPQSEVKRARPLKALPRLAFELIIVFFGVWGALWAESRREDAKNREKAIRIAEAMVTSLGTDAIGWAEPFIAEQQAALAGWKESYDRGDRPLPFFFRVGGGERGPAEVWDAAIAAGLIDVLDPGLVSDLGLFYRELDGMTIRLSRYHARTEELIYPGLDEGVEWYYRDGSARLKPEYEGFMRQTEEVLGEWAKRNSPAPRLRDTLSAVIEELRR